MIIKQSLPTLIDIKTMKILQLYEKSLEVLTVINKK